VCGLATIVSVDGTEGVADVSALEAELRERLERLANGDASVRDFQAWFVPTFWDESDMTESARVLGHQVELVISEYTSGAWTWDEATKLLRGLLGVPVVEAQWGGGYPRLVTGTTSILISRSRVPEGQEAADLRPAEIRYAAARG
jgi:hypothetical protein